MKSYLGSFLFVLLVSAFVNYSFAQSSPLKESLSSSALKGSVAQENITPPVGSRLAGHFYETFSTGIHDPLWAKAMLFQQGTEKYAFVFCDLIGLNPNVSTHARALASAKTGIPVKNIVIAATHTHTAPLFYGFQHSYFHGKAISETGVDPHEKIDYSQFLINQLVKAIVKANGEIQPVQLEVNIAEQHTLSFNRRYHMQNGKVLFNPGPLNPEIVRPAGPTDPEVGILLIKNSASKTYEGGLTVFAMHADCTGGTEMSADYPYYLAQTLKNKLGKKFISAFALGPSGDINGIDVKKDLPMYSAANVKHIGETLGNTVIKSMPKMKVISKPSLSMLSSKILLPLQVPSKNQIDSAQVLINDLYKVRETGMYLKNAGGESGDFMKRVEMSKYLALKNQHADVQVEVQVFRLDSETAIVGLPGELFVELGLEIKKRSPFKDTIVITVCNDKTSYIPTIKAFNEGSYEVTNAIVIPGAGEMLVETAVDLLKTIR